MDKNSYVVDVSDEEYGSLETTLDENESSEDLPPYDEANGTRKILLVVFILSVALSMTGLIVGVRSLVIDFGHNEHEFATDWEVVPGWTSTSSDPSPATSYSIIAKMLTLVFTITVLVCTECLGYIHSTSLRWGLAKEGRLEFNSNLRLFSSTRILIGNGRCANFFSAVCLILCYAGASCTVIEDEGKMDYTDYYFVMLSKVGITSASFGLFGLCTITGFGWFYGEKSGTIKSWNPHPLNTALVCLHHNMLFRNTGRATIDASQRHIVHQSPHVLTDRQPSALTTIPKLKHINRFAIAISCITFCAACALMITMWKLYFPFPYNPNAVFVWVFFPTYSYSADINTNLLYIDTSGFLEVGGFFYWPLLWSFLCQSISTLTFHVIELVVNLRRDETCWRKAIKIKGEGASFNQSAFYAAVSNKGSIALFCLKPLGQWIYTQGLYNVEDSTGVNPLPLLVLSALLGLMTLATLLTSRHRPKRPLPSTYGHLQTIVDIVDDWGKGAQGQLLWGDRGEVAMDYGDGMAIYRCAGTSGDKKEVGEILMDEKYSLY